MTDAGLLKARRPNPFASDVARAHSNCVAWRNDRIERVPDLRAPVPPFVAFVHDAFRALVLNPHFSCLGAKAAAQAGTYRLGVYGDMASPGASAGLAHDLFEFAEDQRAGRDDAFATFIAVFTGPVTTDELSFERHLWAQLRALHRLDRAHHMWDPRVSPDPENPDFAFSFGERAFFVVGMHPASSRWARRFTWPTLVFNPHAQFDRLRQDGKYASLRDAIRTRERELQGSLNPMLSDHGEGSQARQYAGRAVEADWRCPFPHATEDETRWTS